MLRSELTLAVSLEFHVAQQQPENLVRSSGSEPLFVPPHRGPLQAAMEASELGLPEGSSQ